MEIQINGQALDFTLEKEKYLGEIIEEIQGWLKKSNLIISKVEVDGNELMIEEKQIWGKNLINKIGSLNIDVHQLDELKLSSYDNANKYLSLLYKAVKGSDINSLNELIDGLPSVIKILKIIFPSTENIPIIQSIKTFTDQFSGFTLDKYSGWTTKQKEDAVRITGYILRKIEELIEEEKSPLKVLVTVTERLRISIKAISEVSIQLQTGKDKEAMTSLIVFAEVLEQLVRILQRLKTTNNLKLDDLKIEGIRFEDYYNELNTFLKELLEAFKINDSVLIGDLLEYEIAPKLQALIKFLEALYESGKIKNGPTTV